MTSISVRRVGLLALLAMLLFAAPVFAQTSGPGLDQMPGPQSPTTKDQVQLYNPAQDQIMGRVSIPDYKAALLVQPEGRDWRTYRNVASRVVAGVLIVGMVALLAFVYVRWGKVRLERGLSGRTITRFNGLERFAHWTTAISFLVLALTGLLVLFGRILLMPLIGRDAFASLAYSSKLAHNFLSVPFVVGILIMLVLWLRDNLPERADLVWLRQGGGFFTRGPHPETGKFNAGQKMVFWSVVLGGLIMAVSGYLLMFPFYATGISGMQFFHVVHTILGALLITLIIGHIYIGTMGMEGAFGAMGSGRVDENWAREHHSRWYQEARARDGRTPQDPDVGHKAAAD